MHYINISICTRQIEHIVPILEKSIEEDEDLIDGMIEENFSDEDIQEVEDIIHHNQLLIQQLNSYLNKHGTLDSSWY